MSQQSPWPSKAMRWRSGDAVQASVLALVLAFAVAAWLVADARMVGMDAGPGTDPGTLGFYVSTWVAMMAAMMLPSAAPTVSVYAMVGRRRRTAGAGASVAAFVGGYLLTWLAFGLAAYAFFEIVRSLDLDALDWDRGGPWVAGAVVALAAGYQLTPLKDACLRHCRNPLGFVMGSWREGRSGALAMGIHHGAWCVGCCWALMAALFAVGVMSVAWMAFFAFLVAAEKLIPWGRVLNLAIVVILLALAIGVALSPGDVPGLTLPDSPQAEMAREGMEMTGPPAFVPEAGGAAGQMGN